MTDTNTFESLIDYAHRSNLHKYDDGRVWFLLLDKNLELGKLAYSIHTGDLEVIKELINKGYLIMEKSIKDIPGDDFYCIYFEDAYLLKPYNPIK